MPQGILLAECLNFVTKNLPLDQAVPGFFLSTVPRRF